jgi:hypothetical protein
MDKAPDYSAIIDRRLLPSSPPLIGAGWALEGNAQTRSRTKIGG